jgi:hypothetical protein
MATHAAQPRDTTGEIAGPAGAVASTGGRGAALEAVAAIAAFVAVALVVQFAVVAVPYDADTAYHVAVGHLVRQHGILRAFPWTPFSWLADHYADKELLFHLLFVPLAALPWVTAAKIVGVVAETLVLVAIWVVLRREGVRLAVLWALAPLLACEVFVFRFSIVRPHLLSIALATVVLWAAVRGRLAVLAAASVLYPWCYVALPLPLALVGIAEVARAASGERLRWKVAAVAVGGLALGVALHPNGWNLVRLSWIVIARVLVQNAWGNAPGLELGGEFEPFAAGEWLRLLAVVAVMALCAAVLAWRDRRRDPLPVAFSAAALAFGLLTVRTARFAEYFAPLATTAFALASRRVSWRPLAPIALGVSALYGAPPKLETLQALGTRADPLTPQVEATVQRVIPPGAQVFTCEWGLTGRLMLALPGRRFVVALDPTLFLVNDPELYRIWYDLPRQARPGEADVIRQRFGARFVICRWDDRFERFFNTLAFEPRVQTVSLADDWNVYDLGTRGSGPGSGTP